MPKILYFHDGMSRFDEFLVDSLSEYFDMKYLTFNPKPSVRFRATNPIILSHPFSTSFRSKLARPIIRYTGAEVIRSTIRKENPNAILGAYATTYGFLCAKAKFHPNILFLFGSDILVDSKKPILHSLVARALHAADLILLESTILENAVMDFGVKRAKIIRMPLVNIESIVSVPKSQHSLRERLGWQSCKIILSARNFEKLYQIDKIVRAFADVHSKFPETRLILAGRGSEAQNLKSLVSMLGIESSVYFSGWVSQEQLFRFHDESDVYVSASLSDSTSASLLEAMVRRVLVLVSNIAGNREWIIDGKNGFLFNPFSYDDLKTKMIDCLSLENQCRDKIISDAYNTVCDGAKWKENMPRLVQAIQNLIYIQNGG
ncbi:MAG: glycosyltransferase [Nitrososphaerales archaeon]